MTDFRFSRNERLKSQTLLTRLFNREGQSFAAYPIRVVWLETSFEEPIVAKATFSVPKRRFKKAVERNLLRRRMSEAYRLHKADLHHFLAKNDQQYALIFIFTGAEIVPFSEIENKMSNIIKRLSREVKKK